MANSTTHIVAVPFPGFGNINPMMNLCTLLAARDGDILVTLVLTEEWLARFSSSAPMLSNLRLVSVPNVIPSEQTRGVDFVGHLVAVFTKMEAPFERLLDEMVCRPVTGILADGFMPWAVAVGNRRGVPAFSLWTQSASVFDVFYHFDLLASNHHLPGNLSERGEEYVDYIPGIKSTKLADLHAHCFSEELLHWNLDSVSWIPKAQCLLLTSFYELEPHVIDTLKTKFSIPIYPIGPTISYMRLHETQINRFIPFSHHADYNTWLDSQPRNSVLYVSLGSFLTVSGQQMDEIAFGLCAAKIRYLWVVRENHSQAQIKSGDRGMVVPWCEQLRVLCHPSVGGFFTHCGWNSTNEGVFAGLPMLTFPLSLDQFPNSKLIVDDWKIGLRVKQQGQEEIVVKREEIAKLVQILMDTDGDVSKEMRRRGKELQVTCHGVVQDGGSSHTNLNDFIRFAKGSDD